MRRGKTRTLDCTMSHVLHPQARLAIIAAWLVIGAWCVLALLIVQLILGQFQAVRGAWFLEASIFVSLLSALIVLGVFYALLAFSLRCQACGKRFYVEAPGPKDSNARRIFGMDHWASAVIDILRRGKCTCMYCGALVRVRP